MLYFADPLPLPEHPAEYAATELDTIVWQAKPGGVMVISWARALTPHGVTFRMPMSFGSVGFDDHPVVRRYVEHGVGGHVRGQPKDWTWGPATVYGMGRAKDRPPVNFQQPSVLSLATDWLGHDR